MSLLRTLGAGVNAMNAYQTAVMTTGQNITNANTEGYHQQQAVLGRKSRATAGVQVLETRRATDVFIERQATIQLGTKSYHDTRNKALIAVESTVGMMGDNALTTYFDEFYNSWYELSANAQDPAQRFATYNRTVEVADAIRRSAEELTKSQQNTNEEIARLTEETNLLIERGAKLNIDIAKAEATGQQANELRDDLDQVTQRLAELVGARATEDADGYMRIHLESGFTLVNQGYGMNIHPEAAGVTGFYEIAMTDTAGMTITNSVGGQLGALLKIRDEDLEEQKTYLDDVAFNFANAANTAHGNGFDMDGNAGVDLFTVSGTQAGSAISLQVNTAISNAGDPARLLAAKAAATNGNGDGTVAEQIADLDEALLCATGTKTVYQQVNLMVTKLGQLVRDSEQSAESAESRHIVLSDLKDAAVGVSIEEEMVALQTYQKSFQAASRIIRTIDEMMGTLVNM